MSVYKKDLKKLPIKDALELITDNVADSNNFILLQARHNSLENQNMLGTISSENYNMQLARIRNSLFHFIDELDDNVLAPLSEKIKGLIKPKAASVNPDPVSPDAIINEKQKILYCVANVHNLEKLDFYREIDELRENIKSNTNDFQVERVKNLTVDSLINAIIDEQPNYLHFSGHGIDTNEEELEKAKELDLPYDKYYGGLVFYDDEYKGTKILNANTLSRMFSRIKKSNPYMKYIILNACFAEEQALEISKQGFYALGYTSAVKDKAAIAFTSGFYRGIGNSLGFNRSLNAGIIKALDKDIDFERKLRVYHNGEQMII